MHVLIVSAWDPSSGVLTVYRSLARHLGSSGIRFSAFAFDGWRQDTEWTFCDELIDGRSITLAEVLMSGQHDLVHCVDTTYSPPYGVETWVRRSRFRGPVVLMAQQLARRELTGPVHATRYVACSQDAADVLAEDADGPVLVIPNGYDERIFRPGPTEDPGRPQLVWVGRSYDPQKDVHLFLDVVESLPGYGAVLVDADPESAAVRGRLGRLGPRVQLRSRLDPSQMAEMYRTAASSGGAFLSTSRSEGFHIAAVEAMACACPVIAPRIPGYGHLVDGVNAIVYDRDARVDGVTNAIGRLSDSALRAELIASAQRMAAQHWTSRAMAVAYLRVYQDALDNAPSVRGHHVSDAIARTAWRVALKARPAWHQARRLAGG